MKIKINNTDYIEILNKNNKGAELKIKIQTNKNTSSFINLDLNKDSIDKVITELVKIRAKID